MSGAKIVGEINWEMQPDYPYVPKFLPECHSTAEKPTEAPQQDVKLVDIEVTNENVALNIMVSFLNLAHKRGAFGMDESAKIWECVNKFKGGR